MGEIPHPDAEMTAEGTPPPFEVLAQLPASVVVHGAGEGHPLLYRNAMAKRLGSGPVGPMLARLDHPRLRDLAGEVIATREPSEVELRFAGPGGVPLQVRWQMAPLAVTGAGVTGLVSIVEDMSQPARARRRIEDAVDHGISLLLEVARLAETSPDLDTFVARMEARLATLVKADRVAFHRYDPASKALVLVAADACPPCAATLPCDPDSSDLLSQVVFAGRVYRGELDLTRLEARPYVHFADVWHEVGSQVLMVPWRAGNEHLGAVVAYGPRDENAPFSPEASIVLIAAGHAAGLVWQRKRAEQKLAERAIELESLEEAKTSFLMLASHELRTPLTLLNGYVSMLADDASLLTKETSVLPVLQDALQRMNALVDQLMEVTRLTEGQAALRVREVDLAALVEARARQTAARWHRLSDLVVSVPEHPVSGTVDVLRIETVVGNLVDNAFKYSEPGGEVRCELLAGSHAARLLVVDEGFGMSDEELSGLFTRFGRIVNRRNSHIGGTGLGLYLSRQIARLHGGEVTATSIDGAGSCFELTLPYAFETDRMEYRGEEDQG